MTLNKITIWVQHQLRRILYLIKHKKDDYGKPGFMKLSYNGTPIVFRDEIPPNKIIFMKSSGDYEILDLTDASIKYMNSHAYPWETDNHICKWCGANYTSAEIHATKHDYGS